MNGTINGYPRVLSAVRYASVGAGGMAAGVAAAGDAHVPPHGFHGAADCLRPLLGCVNLQVQLRTAAMPGPGGAEWM